ncbi:MAG TPA: helix-turn-helix domain-containing protein [Nitrosopumilaceae archaeon]|nr:helix-turn-helix domain-containing protein [Nitrosopumilaceae archaeon]
MSGKEKNLAIFDSEPGSHLYEHKIRLEKIRNELFKFGLTPTQAKIYIYLAKFGSKSAPDIIKALSLPRTETYYVLNALQSRGIITAELSSPMKYTALPLEQTMSVLINTEKEKINILSKQQEEVLQIWNEIPPFTIETNEIENEKVQMMHGNPPILNKITNMINTAKEGIAIFGSVKDLSRFHHSAVFDTLPNSILDVRIVVSPAQTLPQFAEKIDKKRIKLMPSSEKDNQCFVIKDHDEILVFLRNATHPSSDMFAVWSDSKPLIDSMHNLFDYSWDDAEVCY